MREQLVECFRKLPDLLGGHMLLSLAGLAVGLVVSLPLGLLASRRPRLAEAALGLAGGLVQSGSKPAAAPGSGWCRSWAA